ncbi:MAG: hypothetical protein JRD89_16905 [Deltaproteobacteria bacterium]|nr:hypothetical protein [Deltaproteobacteria bacterium]
MYHPFRWLLSRRTKEPKLKTIRELAGDLEVSRLFADGGDEGTLHFDVRELCSEDASSKLFKYYSAEGVHYALETLGIFKLIEAHGFRDFKVEITGDAWSQLLRIWGQASGRPLLVVEGCFRRSSWTVPAEMPLLKSECGNHAFNVAFIDWITLQNPLADFTPERPRLPGQKYPGLGIFHEVMEVFYAVARRLHLDALLLVVDHFHNAVIYKPSFFFVDPGRQAELVAIERAGAGRSLQDMALALEAGLLCQGGRSEPYAWHGDLMINPLASEIQGAHQRCGYAEKVEEISRGLKFEFDWPAFDARRATLGGEILEEGPV